MPTEARSPWSLLAAAFAVALAFGVASGAQAQRLCIEGGELMTLPIVYDADASADHAQLTQAGLEAPSLSLAARGDDADDDFALVCVSANDARCMPAVPPSASSLGAADQILAAFAPAPELVLVLAHAPSEIRRYGGLYLGCAASGVRQSLERPPRTAI